MPRTRIALFAALAVLVLVMAGCSKQDPPFTADDQLPADEVAQETEGEGDGEGSGGGEPVGKVEFVAEDVKFTGAPSTVPAGNVTFELVNDGAAPHDVTIEELGDETVVKANGGESASGEVELEPGTYTYFCSVPGHRAGGMEGEFTVE